MAVTVDVDNAPVSTKESYVDGMIYPPPDIRSIVDKTAAFTAKNANPSSFEDKIRARQAADNRFNFINADDAYNAYYLNRVKFYKDGGVDAAPGKDGTPADAANTASRAIAGAAAEMVDEGRPKVPQPRPFQFIDTDKPPMAPVDSDILKLTALFTARMGRGFTSELATRESGNYQFDFLRPSHSLFGYFNRLVEQYTRILIPPQETLTQLDSQSGHTANYDALLTTEEKRQALARREILNGIENRVEWQKYDNARRQAEDTAAEEERVAMATIDWQDFIVVSTIEFTDQDELLDLPPPMSRSEVENMTMAQKKMAAMIMEGKDVASAAVESGSVSKEAEEAEMQMSDDEADVVTKRVEQAHNLGSAAAQNGPAGNIKIRKDYVPKSQRGKKVAMTTCQICGQQIAESEMAEHVRIELLDPRWKEQRMVADAKRTAANMLDVGTDVAQSLRQIATRRGDIFTQSKEDDERRKQLEQEERIRKREREKIVWDGHTASAISTAERFQSGANLDEQIAALHRAKGLTLKESNIGPRPAPSGSQDSGSSAFMTAPGSFAGATMSAAPNPQAQAQPQAYQQSNAYQGYPGYQQYTPEQLAQMQQYQQYQQQGAQTGQARPAEQSADPNKRQRQ